MLKRLFNESLKIWIPEGCDKITGTTNVTSGETPTGKIPGECYTKEPIEISAGQWNRTTSPPVPCFMTGMCKNWVPYHQLQHHLLLDHLSRWRPNRVPRLRSTLVIHDHNMQFSDTDWAPKWLQAYENDFVLMVTRKSTGHWFAWVWILGGASEEQRFLSKIRFSKGEECFSGKIPVSSYGLRGWDLEIDQEGSRSVRFSDAIMKQLLGNGHKKVGEVEVCVEIEINLAFPPAVNPNIGSGDSGCSVLGDEDSEFGIEISSPVECLFGICNRWFSSYKGLKRHLESHPMVPVVSPELITWVVFEAPELNPEPGWDFGKEYTYKYCPKWLETYDHDFFLMMIRKSPGVWYLWVEILDDPEVAEGYCSTIQLRKEDSCIGGDYPVYSVKISDDAVVADQKCFLISDENLKEFLNLGENLHSDVKVLVKIQPVPQGMRNQRSISNCSIDTELDKPILKKTVTATSAKMMLELETESDCD